MTLMNNYYSTVNIIFYLCTYHCCSLHHVTSFWNYEFDLACDKTNNGGVCHVNKLNIIL